MKQIVLIIGLGIGFFPTISKAINASWPSKFIDIHPMKDDFVLPLPCGGKMVFRKVEVPTEGGVLDDLPIQIGQSETQQGYSDYIRQAQLAAPFSSGVNGSNFYYIGKYDVTRNQYDAILDQDSCKQPDQSGQKAVNNISWFEAQNFAENWSVWLLQHAKNSLPKRGNKYGYIRLPTEAEWYYAAQGGNKVSETDFLAPTWPMPEGIEEYVMAGSELANGQVQTVGSMKPNPLGLYDMLGEVGQMMQDYYHLNRVGRQHGLTGGIIVKGGNYTFNPSDLNTALREEIPLYDQNTNQPTHLATMGFRVVISAPTLGSLQETNQASSEFDQLLQKSQKVTANTHQLIDKLKKQTTEASLKAGLEQISTQLDQDARARNDFLAATMRAQIEAASALALNIWENQHTILILEKELSLLNMLSQKQKNDIKSNIINHKQILNNSIDGYLETIRKIADSSSIIDRKKQFTMIETAYKARKLNNLAFFADRIQVLLSLPKSKWTNVYVLQDMKNIQSNQARDSVNINNKNNN